MSTKQISKTRKRYVDIIKDTDCTQATVNGYALANQHIELIKALDKKFYPIKFGLFNKMGKQDVLYLLHDSAKFARDKRFFIEVDKICRELIDEEIAKTIILSYDISKIMSKLYYSEDMIELGYEYKKLKEKMSANNSRVSMSELQRHDWKSRHYLKIDTHIENLSIQVEQPDIYIDKYAMITYVLLRDYLHLARRLRSKYNGKINFGFYSQSVEGSNESDGMIYLLHNDMQKSSDILFFTEVYEICQTTLSKQELNRLVISYDVLDIMSKIYY